MSKKASVLVRVQQNDATLKGVWLKFPVRDEAVNFFKALKKNTVCTSVKVVGPGIDDKACVAIASCLASNSTLTYVDISECDLGSEGLREIAKGIKESKSIKGLRIGPLRRVCSPTDFGVEAILAACCDSNSQITRLELARLALTPGVGKHIWKYLSKTKIKTFLLEGDPIGEEGIHGLLSGIKAYNGLQSLYLHKFDDSLSHFLPPLIKVLQNAASPLQKLSLNGTPCKEKEIIAAIAEIFNVNTHLTELELSGCKLNADFVVPLLQVLNSAKPLKRLDLSDNEIDQIRLLSLTKATGITELNLAGNKLTEELLVMLTQQLPKNSTLTKLNISRNFFPVESARNYLNPITMAACKIQELIFDQSGSTSSTAPTPGVTPGASRASVSPADLVTLPLPEHEYHSSSSSGPPSPLASGRERGQSGRASDLTRPNSNSFSSSVSPLRSHAGSTVSGLRSSENMHASIMVARALANPNSRLQIRAALCEEIVVETQPVAIQMIGDLLTKMNQNDVTMGSILGDVTARVRAFLSN